MTFNDKADDAAKFSAKFHQRWLPPTVSRRPSRKVASSGPNDPDPVVDVRAVVQGTALRHPLDLHALLHLRHHRNAGKTRIQKGDQ